MPRFYRVLRALVAVLLAAGALAPGTRAGTVKVAATIFPLHDIARGDAPVLRRAVMEQ